MPRIKAGIADSLRFDGQLVIQKLECEFLSISEKYFRDAADRAVLRSLNTSSFKLQQVYVSKAFCASVTKEGYSFFFAEITIFQYVLNRFRFLRNVEEGNKNRWDKNNKLC